MKLRHLFFPLFALLMMLSACSKHLELLETVPADLRYAVSFNVNKLMDELQIKADSTGVTMPPQLQMKWGLDNRRLALLAKVAGSSDLDHVILGLPAKGDPFFVLAVTDPVAFDAALADYGCERTDKGGYAVYADSGFSVAVADGKAWIIDGDADKTVASVNDILDRASDRSMADVEGVKNNLSDNSLACVAANLGAFNPKHGGDTWGVIDVGIKDNAIVGDFIAVNADGSPADSKELKRIDTSVLRYSPDDALIVGVAGLTSAVDWEGAFGFLAGIGAWDAAQQARMQMVLPYLKAIDGTIMVSVSPVDGADGMQSLQKGFDGMNFIVMVHMDQKTVNDALGNITEMASTMGEVKKAGEGLYSFMLMNREVYAGNIDGYLTFSTFRPSDNNGSSIAARFTGKTVGFSVRLPEIPNAGYGMDMIVTGSESKGYFSVNLIGTDAPILLTLFQ